MLKREAPQIKSGAILSCVHASACYWPVRGRLLAIRRCKLSYGQEYELHLCERCFFSQIAEMKSARWLAVMFDEEGDAILVNDA